VALRFSIRTLVVAIALAAILGAVGMPGGARAATPGCGGASLGLVCSDVVVPLDRSGVVPGTVDLHVETLPAQGPSLGAVFLLAGGPGQGSAHVFGLGSTDGAALFRFAFPDYTLVAYDDRGTGASGLLDCPALQTSTSPSGQDLLAAGCATSLGAAAPFYGTTDHAADLDAVRAALGFDKITLFGVSYGTKLALAYASAYPTHVARIVLDSVLPPSGPDPFSANVARAIPAKVAEYCSTGACRAATSSVAADLAAVANRLAAKPVRGDVLQLSGKAKRETLDGAGVLSTVVDSDLNPALAAELPAAVHAARVGNVKPLMRLVDLDTNGSQTSAVDLSDGLFAATVCRDGPFPWPAGSSPADRAGLLSQAIAALPAGSFGPFGSYVAKLGNAEFCDDWPAPTGDPSIDSKPYPNVPLLALSGGYDMRTPTDGSQSVVAQFPQGHLVVVPGIGHSVVTADPSGCAARAVRDWIASATVPAAVCPRPKFIVAPLAAYPSASTPRHLGASATYALAGKTLREAEAAWLMVDEGPPFHAVAGLYHGRIDPSGATGFKLASYSIAPGVTLSGAVHVHKNTGLPLAFDGSVTVGGSSASRGVLHVVRSSLSGTLGGKHVGAGRGLGPGSG
jgi:pimeloyl-ACP methyl ester carboxylesterase